MISENKLYFTNTRHLADIAENQYRSKDNTKDYWDVRHLIDEILVEREQQKAEMRQKAQLEAYNSEDHVE